ncbi:MAG: hypothetical protein LBJ47_00625 [Tannerella sp.]|nr:hypothetical protein [Tannerella sp.]
MPGLPAPACRTQQRCCAGRREGDSRETPSRGVYAVVAGNDRYRVIID